jgi:glycerol-3-phosphate dehydrogenase subunit C
MQEGSLGAPERHVIPWRDDEFYDELSLDKELRRVFDICHGCRRCFNLCDSFPKLFDLIDDSDSGELDTVSSTNFEEVIDSCTLCDLCFMTKCPYVPPHEFNLDFPHLMLRARAVKAKNNGIPFVQKELTKTDRNGLIGGWLAPISNWIGKCGNNITRPAMELILGVHRDAILPKFSFSTFKSKAKENLEINRSAPAFGRKVVIFSTCFSNYNNPEIGLAARRVLAKNGVESEVVYPKCCGMPQFEHGDIAAVAESALTVSASLRPWIEKKYSVIALIPSCALMMKFEWPLIVPESDDVLLLSKSTQDITEYIVDIAKTEGVADGLGSVEGGVTMHVACHARAQNMGQKGVEMLRIIPGIDINVIERCSGHGGSWGIMKGNFETAMKIGRPAYRKISELKQSYIVSECPLAREHLVQGAKSLAVNYDKVSSFQHPIQVLASAYGL